MEHTFSNNNRWKKRPLTKREILLVKKPPVKNVKTKNYSKFRTTHHENDEKSSLENRPKDETIHQKPLKETFKNKKNEMRKYKSK